MFAKPYTGWINRRWRPGTRQFIEPIHLAVEFEPDTHVPVKGFNTGWRWKWSWGLVRIDRNFTPNPENQFLADDVTAYPVWPMYMNKDSEWRLTWLPVTTLYVAFRLGPEKTVVSFLDSKDFLVKGDFVSAGLTYSQVVLKSHSAVTFV